MLSTKQKNMSNTCNDLQLFIGFNETTKSDVYIPKSGLYQNFLITGTIGSGKTSSAMYPFTEQILKFNSRYLNKKIAIPKENTGLPHWSLHPMIDFIYCWMGLFIL